MKLYNKLDEILNQPSKIKVLRFLFAEGGEHTGRGVAKATGLSPSMTHGVLGEMKAVGIIGAQRKDNAVLYCLKRDNYFVKKLLAVLFEKEEGIYDDVVDFIKTKLKKYKATINSLAVFGSVAQGNESKESDFDLLVVVKLEQNRVRIESVLDELCVDLAKEFGIALSPYILSRARFKKRYLEKKKVIEAIIKNNQLIYGEPVERIIA